MFPLLQEEKLRLQKLNQDKTAVFALKKLFLNTSLKGAVPLDVQTLAAERIALDIIQDAFKQLDTIQPDNQTGERVGNLV